MPGYIPPARPSAATVGRQRACGREAGDRARNGPHEELLAQGIARARVVLSGTLARCQREAARAFTALSARDPGQATCLRITSASFWQPESMWLMEAP